MEGCKLNYIVLLFLITTTLFGSQDTNTSVKVIEEEQSGLVKVEDATQISEKELRKKAKKFDETQHTKVGIDEQEKLNLAKLQKPWEELSPKADRYDWVQTKKGEWFKGRIISLYDDRLEFDSEEMDEHTFKMKKIRQIKSYRVMSVNIENIAIFSGILRYKDGKVTVIQGEHTYDFDIKDVISIAPEGEREVDLWSGKITLSLDTRRGNTNQSDFAFDGRVIRRTSHSILELKYLGRVSSREKKLTANNQRFNQRYDYYQTRFFFWTPLATEYYSDKFRNINHQITAGTGAGYTFFKEGDDEWKISTGPSAIYTRFESTTIENKQSHTTLALEVSTDLSLEINKVTDLKYSYKFTLSDKETGRYKHHMVTTLENELTSWLDFDVSLIWDYLHVPQEKEDGEIPKRNDVQLLVGLGIDF